MNNTKRLKKIHKELKRIRKALKAEDRDELPSYLNGGFNLPLGLKDVTFGDDTFLVNSIEFNVSSNEGEIEIFRSEPGKEVVTDGYEFYQDIDGSGNETKCKVTSVSPKGLDSDIIEIGFKVIS